MCIRRTLSHFYYSKDKPQGMLTKQECQRKRAALHYVLERFLKSYCPLPSGCSVRYFGRQLGLPGGLEPNDRAPQSIVKAAFESALAVGAGLLGPWLSIKARIRKAFLTIQRLVRTDADQS